MSIKSGNQQQLRPPNKYKDIKGYLNSDHPIPARALLKETNEMLELPPNAVLLGPVKNNSGELLTKAVKFYKEGQTFNASTSDINDCFNILLLNENDSKLIIGAVTFAPFIVEDDELLIYILLLKVQGSQQKKGNGATLFNIMKNFTMKCQLSRKYSKVQLLLSASTTLKPHGFFLKQGCEFVADNDLLELTQKDSSLMRLKLVDQKCGDQSQNQRASNVQLNNQNGDTSAIAETIQHHVAMSDINVDHDQGGGRTSKDEETKQAISGWNSCQPDHLFDNIQRITPNDSNRNNEIQEFKLPLNKRNLKALNRQQDAAASNIGSKVSMVSNKTDNGHIKRHCELCGFKQIANWTVHKKKVHGGNEVSYVKCLPLCTHCTGQQQQQQQQQSKSEHKMGQCSKCGSRREVRHLSNGFCTVCAKKMGYVSKSAINVPLNDDHVMDFDGGDSITGQQVDPDDSISMVGTKRLAVTPLNFDEVMCEADSNHGQQEQLSSPIAQRQVQDTQTQSVSIVNTDMAVTTLLDTLKTIETSLDTDFEVSLEVSAICEQFVHQQALTLLKKDSYSRLASLITMMLNEQAGQLKQQQLAGLFVAASKLQGPCQNAAVIMLQKRKSDIQQYVLEVFNSHIEFTYGTDIAQWIGVHWRNVQDQQFDIMKQLKGVQSPIDILFLSLAVQVDDVPKFIKQSSFMLQRGVSVYMLESICNKLKQQHLSIQQFLELCKLVQLDNVTSIIQDNADIFKSSPLQHWQQKIEQLKAVRHLLNADSIMDAIQEFIQQYGPVESPFDQDLFADKTHLGLALHEYFNQPNAKQLGLAQYCMGIVRKCPRQLWNVPSGQGKSRIIAFAAAIAIHTGMFNSVHISFENAHLMDRDRKDFETLWELLEFVDKVHYHVGCEFPTVEGDLIIVDESDTATFNTPDAFVKLIDSRACICFTATPDNGDAKGAEASVINALHLKTFQYEMNADIGDVATKLKIDHIQHADSIESKVTYIANLRNSGPVLVYGDLQLLEGLKPVVSDLIAIDHQADYSMLCKLDQAPYKVLFAVDQFGMRGIDYRCERVHMHLVIAQSFDCTREALQGVARVGRFGDPCKRIIFNGVELVDRMKQFKYTTRLMKYANTTTVTVKQVKVKTAAVPQQKNTGATNVGKRQVQAANKQTAAQQQQQKAIKDFITTNMNK